jgi:ATP-binding cassette subfamily B protein
MIISPLMMVGEVGVDLLLPFLMSFIINYGIYGADIAGSPVASRIMALFHGVSYSQMDLIVTFGILMLALTLVGGFFGVACTYASATAGQGMGHDLRCASFRKVMSLSVEQTDSFTIGSLVTRMTNDIAMIIEFMEMLLRGFIRPPLFVFGGIFMSFLLDARFGAVNLCALPILGATLFLVMRKAIPLYAVIQKRLDKVSSLVQENVSGARVVKAYVMEDQECERFDAANVNLRDTNYNVQKLLARVQPVMTLLMNASVIALIAIGGASIRSSYGGMSTGSIIAAITYTTQAIMSMLMASAMLQSSPALAHPSSASAKFSPQSLSLRTGKKCQLHQATPSSLSKM